jgi:hypothetical protein
VRRNRRRLRVSLKGKKVSHPDSIAAIKSAAFALSLAIFKKGTRPRPFLFPSWDLVRPRFIEDVERLAQQGAP